MHVMLLLRLCCVIYFIQIKEKGLLNPFYSSLFIFILLFLSISIYNILTTKCQNLQLGSLMWFETKFIPIAVYKHMGQIVWNQDAVQESTNLPCAYCVRGVFSAVNQQRRSVHRSHYYVVCFFLRPIEILGNSLILFSNRDISSPF